MEKFTDSIVHTDKDMKKLTTSKLKDVLDELELDTHVKEHNIENIPIINL